MKKQNFISNNIKYLRSTNNLTQEDFGKIVNKSPDLVGGWEKGIRKIQTEELKKIADYFKLPVEILLTKNLWEEDIRKEIEAEKILKENKKYLKNDDWDAIIYICTRAKKRKNVK